ncbi:AAA family ATPase [Helicobacter sp. 23-1046]
MLQSIHIENFKSIEKQTFDFKPLTILTGTNSSGKSSVIQAILLYSHYTARREENYKADSLKKYIENLGDTKSLVSKNANNEQKVLIRPTINKNKDSFLSFSSNDVIGLIEAKKEQMLIFEQDLYFVSANRIGQENRPQASKYEKCGVNGEYIFGFYQKNQNSRIQNEKLIYRKKLNEFDLEPPAESLSAQINVWLRKILDLDLIPNAEEVDDSQIKLKYKNIDLSKKYDNVNLNDDFNMYPFNLGAGVSYLTKILILGLSLKEGDILIVENPEVHLHPKAISNFAEFFMFLAKGGIQVILETHSEHIINKMRYFVFDKQISKDDIQIYYREKFDKPFDSIRINDRGKYINESNEIIEFPAGFFDSDLDELLEMM